MSCHLFITTFTSLCAGRGSQMQVDTAHLESPGKQGKHSIIRLTQTAHHGMDQLLEQGISQIGMAVQKDHQPVAVQHQQQTKKKKQNKNKTNHTNKQKQLPEQLAFAELAKTRM